VSSVPSGAWTIDSISRRLGSATTDDVGTIDRLVHEDCADVHRRLVEWTDTVQPVELTPPQAALLFERRLRCEFSAEVQKAEQCGDNIAAVFRAVAEKVEPLWLPQPLPRPEHAPRRLNGGELAWLRRELLSRAPDSDVFNVRQAYRLHTGVIVAEWELRRDLGVTFFAANGDELRSFAVNYNESYTSLSVGADSSCVVQLFKRATCDARLHYLDAAGQPRWSMTTHDSDMVHSVERSEDGVRLRFGGADVVVRPDGLVCTDSPAKSHLTVRPVDRVPEGPSTPASSTCARPGELSPMPSRLEMLKLLALLRTEAHAQAKQYSDRVTKVAIDNAVRSGDGRWFVAWRYELTGVDPNRDGLRGAAVAVVESNLSRARSWQWLVEEHNPSLSFPSEVFPQDDGSVAVEQRNRLYYFDAAGRCQWALEGQGATGFISARRRTDGSVRVEYCDVHGRSSSNSYTDLNIGHRASIVVRPDGSIGSTGASILPLTPLPDVEARHQRLEAPVSARRVP
jgi:hypothetical protein